MEPVVRLDDEKIKDMIKESQDKMDSCGFSRYVYGRNESGIHIIDIRKQFEKIQLAVWVMVQRDLTKQSEKISDDFRKQQQNAEIKRAIRQRVAHYK